MKALLFAVALIAAAIALTAPGWSDDAAPAAEGPPPPSNAIAASDDTDDARKCVSLEQAAIERAAKSTHPLLGRCVDWTTDDLEIAFVQFEGPGGLTVRVHGNMVRIKEFLAEHRWRIYGDITDVSDYSDNITVDGTVEICPKVD